MRFEQTKSYEIERTWLKMHRKKMGLKSFYTGSAILRHSSL
jgi:hypothetical protein